jgi:hypothetical protein
MSHSTKYSTVKPLWRLVMLIAVGGLLLACPRTGGAAVFSCGSGDVACLITALNTANSNTEADTINLAAGTYTLTAVNNTTEETRCPNDVCQLVPIGNGLPQISSLITIRGTNAATTIIERNPSAPYFRFLHVTASGVLHLEGVTLRNGGGIVRDFPTSVFLGYGGAIHNEGGLTVANVIMKNNSALSGGGFFNEGTALLTQTTVTENEAEPYAAGGLTNSDLLTITNSAIVKNQGKVGGIFNSGFGALMLTNSTLSSNTGADVLGFAGFLNGASATGAIDTSGTALLTNTTVFANVACCGDTNAGGIHSDFGVVGLVNSIVADNIDSKSFPPVGDCNGFILSQGHNLLGTCGGATQESDRFLPTTVDPRLGDLVDTGQPGKVYNPVFPVSLAIDGGDNAFCSPTDQRRNPRVDGDRNGSAICDIGAIEFQPGEVISAPDLLENFISAPPPNATRGSGFAVKDVVKNIGATSAGTSTTRYYLSLNTVKDRPDVLFAGSRELPTLAPGAVSDGTVSLTIPPSTPNGTYFLVACADDYAGDSYNQLLGRVGRVNESDETNNCRASGSLVIVK